MSKDTPAPGAGDVPITLDGEEHILRPTLAAALAMSRGGGDGIMGAVRRCSAFDIDQIIAVVAAGLGFSGTGPKELPEKVWKTGAVNLSAPCIRFLHVLANGGQPPGENTDAGEDKGRPLVAD